MIQRETMRSDPAADVDADCGHFLAIHPDARAARNAPARNPELGQRIDDHLLDGPDISAHVALPFSQIHDWIADDLAGAVISNIAAAISWIKVDAGAAERRVTREQVLRVAIAALGNHMRVFDEQELIGYQAVLALFDEIALDRKCIGVPDAAQIPNFKH